MRRRSSRSTLQPPHSPPPPSQPTRCWMAAGATKRALVQLKDSLASECAGTGVGVHIVSPGMVATDLLLRYATNPRSGG